MPEPAGAQSFLSPTAKGSALEDFWPRGRNTDKPPHFLQLFSASWDMEIVEDPVVLEHHLITHVLRGLHYFLAFYCIF